MPTYALNPPDVRQPTLDLADANFIYMVVELAPELIPNDFETYQRKSSKKNSKLVESMSSDSATFDQLVHRLEEAGFRLNLAQKKRDPDNNAFQIRLGFGRDEGDFKLSDILYEEIRDILNGHIFKVSIKHEVKDGEESNDSIFHLWHLRSLGTGVEVNNPKDRFGFIYNILYIK